MTIWLVQTDEDQPEIRDPLVRYRLTVEDATGLKTEQSGVLDGEIMDSWIADLDEDSALEVAFWTSSFGTGHYGAFLLFEWNGRGLAQQEFPKSAELERFGYGGRDSFTVEGTTVVRYFPVYRDDDANCCPKGGQATATYRMRSGHLALAQVCITP